MTTEKFSTAPKVGLLIQGDPAYSETFIKAHIDNLNSVVFRREELPYLFYGDDHEGSGFMSNAKRWLKQHVVNPKRVAKAAKKVQREGVQVLMGEYGFMGARGIALAKKAKLPIVAHFHGADAFRDRVLNRYLKDYQHFFAEPNAYAIAVSKEMYNQLLRFGAAKERTFLNPNGAQDKFDGKPKPLNERSIDFLYVGRHSEKKAPYLAIMAFKEITQRYPKARMYMVGSGVLYEMSYRMVHAWKLGGNFHLKESVPHEEVSRLMKDTKAFILPSLTTFDNNKEGLPIVILEAMLSGSCCISTYHAGIPDVIEDQKTGFLSEEGDLEGLIAHMEHVLKQPEQAGQIAQNARAKAKENYTLEHHIAGLNQCLAKAIASHKA